MVMSEDIRFFNQAVEAIGSNWLRKDEIDPKIKVLLNRLQLVNVKTVNIPRASQGSLGVSGSSVKKERASVDMSSSNSGGNVASSSNKQKVTKSGTKEKNLPCSQCNLIFHRTSDVRRHERTHLKLLPNICTQCGKGFARKDALKRHFDTLTCKRNRKKLLSMGGNIKEILDEVKQNNTKKA
ncbi:hypothetical protein Kpol_1031p73 [Vanderwaltozyma polyspora DSM 70294]|uniref:C2H2-type domain-containing protein n=1 Tax=Vanderwaltozyma polyspora (strain ATCC 22028 / DSM 70294 / BCRC 21397 / CBS 2163 / NBRC 10782 / NRRL Y-8283 / UCD 57-17) TaxID=436907 RepID=A7TI03_VANPO|nr:uncharacterized protein Kpol_1031p73 [Vanderwaltozyma polyspora DSM 70294]EDO18165.1 hypothetical protein Kpol_1031p73 [Vanderwaltozyma polyspora DSM 70294]